RRTRASRGMRSRGCAPPPASSATVDDMRAANNPPRSRRVVRVHGVVEVTWGAPCANGSACRPPRHRHIEQRPARKPGEGRVMAGRLRGKAAVVTGASSGVGRAIARAFAAEGARVALIARNRDGLEAAAREVRACGTEALVLSLDVS